MRILIISINFYPDPTSTGKYTGELAHYLAGQGHKLHVVCAYPYYPFWKLQPGYRTWWYQRENWDGIEIQRCPLWVPHQPTGLTRLIHLSSFAISSLPAILGQLPWKPEVVLCIAPALMNAPIALISSRLVGAKAWLHLQDFELDAALKLGMFPEEKILGSLAGKIEHLLLDGFEHVSTISNRMLSRLHQKGVQPNKTSLLPNWVDTTKIYPLPDEVKTMRSSLGLGNEKLIVLYAGNMGKKQGLEHLVDAALLLQDHPNLQFVLCGDGAIRAELQAASQNLPNVTFLPVQPFEMLNQLLNMADIHILLQKADTADLVMPSKLSGMLASGKPVIATAKPETEVGQIVNQVGLLIPPDDPNALAEAILNLAKSPATRAELGHKGRKFAVINWDSVPILSDFEGSLLKLVGNQK